MLRALRSISMIGLIAGVLALGGCATKEEVERAQATADSAMSHAQAGESAAQRAQSIANAAAADANLANARLDATVPHVEHLVHHHRHGTWKNVGTKRHKHYRMPK